LQSNELNKHSDIILCENS